MTAVESRVRKERSEERELGGNARVTRFFTYVRTAKESRQKELSVQRESRTATTFFEGGKNCRARESRDYGNSRSSIVSPLGARCDDDLIIVRANTVLAILNPRMRAIAF